ncbi:hypothetical protein [Leptothermofonsia sp. ETS-13]|uniref:hypothetical protein n=1 Tax=Leptothermofonsia sp. ETS-13 TaxID=3035696 RepID=UPI003BA040F6
MNFSNQDDEPFGFSDDWSFPNFLGSEDDEESSQFSQQIGLIFLGLFVLTAVILCVLFYFLYQFGPAIVLASWRLLSHLPAAQLLLVGCFFVVLGVGFYWLRQERRLLYGLIEVCFAVVSIWHAVGLGIVDSSQWLLMIAAVYVLVRGLDNLFSGYKAYYNSVYYGSQQESTDEKSLAS